MATWIGTTGDYNDAANWNPADVPNAPGEAAVFSASGTTSITIGSGGPFLVDAFTFDVGAQAYSIALDAGRVLAFVGTGIVNNSGVAQNLSTGSDGFIQFHNSSSAGSATITVNTADFLQFLDASSGGTARLISNSGFVTLQTSTGALSVGSIEGNGHIAATTTDGGAAGGQILTVGSLNTDTTFSGVLGSSIIVDSTAFGLTKVGTGTLTLSGVPGSKYTLDTTVSGGTLKAGVANTFSSLSAYTIGASGTLDLNGFSQTIGALAGASGSSVKLGSGTLTAGGNHTGVAGFLGIISGTGGFVKEGTGSLTFSGSNTYSGSTTVNHGSLALSGGSALSDSSAVKVDTAGSLVFFDSETIGSLADGANGGGIVMGDGTLTVGTDNNSTTFSGAIQEFASPAEIASLTKIGGGALTLTGTSTYTGATTISSGTLKVDGTLTASAITATGGHLDGTGTVQSVVMNAGTTINPGTLIDTGILATGNLTLNAGAHYNVNITGATAGTQYDQLKVTGSVTLGGTLIFVGGFGGYVPTDGTSFTLIDNDGSDAVSSTFLNLSEGATFTLYGRHYAMSYAGGTGNDVVMTAINDAPTGASKTVGTSEDTAYVFTAADFGFADALDGDTFEAIHIVADPASGQLELDGVTLGAGAVIDVADIAAGKLTYVPAANASGSPAGSFTFRVQDDGGTANGGADTSAAVYTMAVNVTALNDAPTGTNKIVTTTEDTPFVFTVADFGFSDVEGNSLKAVKIATLPAGGVLKLDGVALAAGAIVDAALIAAGKLTYLPAVNANGAPLASFTFNVQDNGGGSDTDLTANSMTINVGAVNDPPTMTASQVLTSLKETADTSGAIKIADLAIGDVDGGSNTLSLAGADKDLFVILGGDLYLKAGAKLDFETNPVLAVTVRLDDASVGANPDDSVNVLVSITDVAEIITGNSKGNVLIGNAWAETINGKGGNDTIKGGGGNDSIRGGAGADRTAGGAGADVFVFKPGDLPAPSFLTQLFDGLNGTYDLITDFTPGKDRIDLSALDANSKKSGNQAFRFEGEGDFGGARGELVYEFYGSKPSARHTIIKGDTNGDGDFDFRIVLKGHHHLDADDFIL